MIPSLKKSSRVVLAALATSSLLSLACDSSPPTTQPVSIRERQDRAINDPMGYKPDFTGKTVGGSGDSSGLTGFDRQGFNRDLKNVLNP